MTELDRMTRLAKYMIVSIGVISIVGLAIPDSPVKKQPKPIVEVIDYDSFYPFGDEYFELDPMPTPEPEQKVYYPQTYGDESYVDFDEMNDEDEIWDYYEED
jgi:hypothetical protein